MKVEAPADAGGYQVASVEDLVAKLKMKRGDLMGILVYVEHDNASVKGATLNTVLLLAPLAVMFTCWLAKLQLWRCCSAAAKIRRAFPKCWLLMTRHWLPTRENVSVLAFAEVTDKAYNHILAPATTTGKTFCRVLLLCSTTK